LQNDGFGSIISHYCLDDRLKDISICLVGNTVSEGEVDGVILATANTNVAKFASTRKVLSVFVERNGHDTVGSVKGLFNTVSVVNVNVDVENTLLIPEQLDDSEDDVIDIAESTGLALFRVMQTTSPVYSDVAFPSVQASGALHGTASADTAKLKKAIKYRAIVSDIVFTLLAGELLHVVWRDLVQEFDVLVRVELRHLVL
jgi:hypothetical protein